MIVYVDDIVLTSNSPQAIDTIKAVLNSNFHIKDLGVLKYFLGLEVSHLASRISVYQKKYCLDLLADSGMLGCKPATTPMDSSLRLHKDKVSLLLILSPIGALSVDLSI